MSTDELSDPHQNALETAEQLREDLEAIAESDLPFAYDAEQILNELEEADSES
jgi:hypothetical protein